FRPEELTTNGDDVIPTIVITEGALKIQTFVSLRPLNYGLATSGVACSHEQLIAAARPYHAQIAFDADHKTTPKSAASSLDSLPAAKQTPAITVCLPLPELFIGKVTKASTTQPTLNLKWNSPPSQSLNGAIPSPVNLKMKSSI